jgi:hypothetical protein
MSRMTRHDIYAALADDPSADMGPDDEHDPGECPECFADRLLGAEPVVSISDETLSRCYICTRCGSALAYPEEHPESHPA